MKILRIECTAVRGLPDGVYSFADPRTGTPLPVVLVTGGPASGKTSLLDAIAAAKEATGSYGALPAPRSLARGGGARIVATWLLSATEQQRAGLTKAEHVASWELGTGALAAQVEPGLRRLFAEHSRSPERGKLEYFPVNRRLEAPSAGAFGPRSTSCSARARATRAAEKYACILDGLRELVAEEASEATRALRENGIALRDAVPDVLATYKQAVAALLPDLRLARFDPARGEPRFLRRSREEVGLAELSDSERQAVLFALAFAFFGLAGSLVLVDEPELHFHAAHHAQLLHGLVGLGRDNQIIVATGSTELVRAASPGQVIELSRGATTPAFSDRIDRLSPPRSR